MKRTTLHNGLAALLVATVGCAEPSGDGVGDEGGGGGCELEGMFRDCEAGIQYCDDIDGALEWGPCLDAPACELTENLPGCQDCELIDGVPTITGSAECVCEGPVDPIACEQTQCLQRWDWSCGECESITGGGDCFSYATGCSDPRLNCDIARPCDRVWAQSSNGTELDGLEDPLAAECVLSSLRDGVSGKFDVIWGEMGDDGMVDTTIISDGSGTVFVEWVYDCPGCFNFGATGRSGALDLQDTAFFDACLADTSDANLIACTVGLVEFDFGQPPPVDYVPPFTTGECATLATMCP